MTNELEKQFFDTFGIEPCVRDWNQYNFAQIKRGLEIFPERQKLADEGYIKITHKKLEPTANNDCIYWEEYHYPQITDRILLELICILTKRFDYADQNWLTKCNDVKGLKVSVLRLLLLCSTSTIEKYKHQVRTLFEEG